MPKKRGFIDRKNAATYRLVPRSQADPLKGDGEASPYVLVLAEESKAKKVNIKLPSCALPTMVDGNEALVKRIIQQKGPRPDWDPDIVAALDDDFNYDDSENILDDDFISKAECKVSDNESDFGSDIDSDGGFMLSDDEEFGTKEPKTGLTQYSLTSVRTDITDLQKTFNAKFEKFFETFDDDQMGPLDEEDVAGSLTLDDKVLEDLNNDMLKYKERVNYNNVIDTEMRKRTLDLANTTDSEKKIKVEVESRPKYDCVSIRSTYSSNLNRPTLIKFETKKLTKRNLKQFDAENKTDREDSNCDGSQYNHSVISASTFRPKNETPEQRRARKKAVKEVKRENRAIKKTNKLAFKELKKRKEAADMNARRNVGFPMF